MREYDRRKSVRLSHPYMLHFRLLSSYGKSAWDISTIRNLSKEGILFYSTKPFRPGAILEIKIHTPSGTENQRCQGQVMRCEALPNRTNLFATVVDITISDDQAKAAIYKAINEYIKNKKMPT